MKRTMTIKYVTDRGFSPEVHELMARGPERSEPQEWTRLLCAAPMTEAVFVVRGGGAVDRPFALIPFC
jgi:hypothetical protein